MRAEILATGSELLTPDRVDTNSLWLTARLDEVGVEVRRKTLVGDDLGEMRDALQGALSRADLVICTGGLGPTEDDVTRAAAAEATGTTLRADPEVEEGLRRRFAERGLAMPANNLRQALVPEGAEVLGNRVGTAPGLLMRLPGGILALLPGPPREMQPMFQEHLLPELRQRAGAVRVARRLLKVVGLAESALDARIAPLARRVPAVGVTVNFTPYDLEIRLAARGQGSEPEEALEALSDLLRQELGEALFSEAGEGLEVVVARLLEARGLDLAVAEVGSAGRLATRLLQAGAPVRLALAAPRPPLGGEGSWPGFSPWPQDVGTALEAARALRHGTGAGMALVLGAVRTSGERAFGPLALCDGQGEEGLELPLVAAADLLPLRASQGGLDRVRRRLMKGPEPSGL